MSLRIPQTISLAHDMARAALQHPDNPTEFHKRWIHWDVRYTNSGRGLTVRFVVLLPGVREVRVTCFVTPSDEHGAWLWQPGTCTISTNCVPSLAHSEYICEFADDNVVAIPRS